MLLFTRSTKMVMKAAITDMAGNDSSVARIDTVKYNVHEANAIGINRARAAGGRG